MILTRFVENIENIHEASILSKADWLIVIYNHSLTLGKDLAVNIPLRIIGNETDNEVWTSTNKIEDIKDLFLLTNGIEIISFTEPFIIAIQLGQVKNDQRKCIYETIHVNVNSELKTSGNIITCATKIRNFIINNDYSDNLQNFICKLSIKKIEEIFLVHNSKSTANNELDKSKVFIVHGHDALAKEEVARFIERLNLKAIILHEQVSSGKTIIEKIEEHSNVGFGIVLYTPCDVGFKENNEKDSQFRARQNVVFEHGFLIGKIGRSNVCVLAKDDVEKPNDIDGVVYVSMDSSKAWQFTIAREMKNSGYDIDMNLII